VRLVSDSTRRRRPYAARVPLEQRREQLLDAALAVIVREGHGAVSVEAVAREAGVTRPVVYGAFDGLGPLLTALLDRQQVRAFGRLLQALPERPEPDDPVGLVSGSVRRLVAMVREDPDTWRMILLPPPGVPYEVEARIEADREGVREYVAATIEGLLADRAGEVDTEVLAHAVLAVVEHFGRLLVTEPERFETERLVAAVRTVLGPLFEALGSSAAR